MKRALIVLAIFGVATIGLFVAPAFVYGTKTVGSHNVDLSKNGETILPIPDVHFCCGSKLLIYLDAAIGSGWDETARELLDDSNMVCEILAPGAKAVRIEPGSDSSWSGFGTTKRLFLGRACPLPEKGGSIRLSVDSGCSGLSGKKQVIVFRQTPCSMHVGFGAIPFFLGALGTGMISLVALIVVLVKAVKKKLLERKIG